MEIEVNDTNFKKEVIESEIPCLVDFWAEWCIPCRMVTPTVKAIAKEYQGKLKVCKLNVDQASQTASQYNIMNIPTLAIFKDGNIVDRIVGVVFESEVSAKIRPFIK